MHLNKLWLSHFRNYESRVFEFKKPTTIVVGQNAAGKTSIIEAVELLATGDSLRASKIEQMIRFEEELGRVKAKVENDGEEITLEVMLTNGQLQGKRTRKRHFSVNDVKRSKAKFVGNLLTVVFRPEDMRLIEGSPKRRRDFMDKPLLLLDREYGRALNTYNGALLKRNRLLTQIREGEQPRSALTYWTLTILKHGELLQEKRREFLEFFKSVDFPVPFSVEYDLSAITEERLEKYADKEIAAGHTLIGPHKDDLIIKLSVESETTKEEKRDIALYGSRGQQRMGVLWLKTCELAFLEEKTGQRPILMLDDILSELDVKHRDLVLTLPDGQQTIITTASEQTAQEIKQQLPNSDTIRLDANS